MRASMACLAPRFSSVRMLQEYVERAYLPAAASFRRRAARQNGVSESLERWSRHLARHWPAVRFGEATARTNGRQVTVSVPVYLGEIERDSVRVELFANPEEGDAPLRQQMTPVEAIANVPNASIYRATIDTARPAGDFTARVVPYHPDARVPIECPLIAWQR